MIPSEELRLKAEKGDANAQLAFGLACLNSGGEETGDARAVDWIRKAADQGQGEAQYQLGLAYQFGRGVEKDCAEAVKWLSKAAEQGHMSAGNQLGWIYQIGQDVQKDCTEAIKWFRKAADAGSCPAQFNLGFLYANGNDAVKDDAEAVKWLHKAAVQGHPAAQYKLGGMYAEGRSVERKEAEALQWFQKAAAQGYAAAHTNLQRWAKTSEGNANKSHSNQAGQDLAVVLRQQPLRILEILRVDVRNLLLSLVAATAMPFRLYEITCLMPVDYSIRPKNPATLEGGPVIELHEKHPLLEADHLQLVPGGDGEVFMPPLKLKLLILDQSHVIAEGFVIRELLKDPPAPHNPQ